MRQDTQNRIKIYRERLPRVREKISATGLALVIAAVVAVSATFAWVTLSRAPEVTGMVTSLSANGSLEIALSKEDGSLPDEFDIDESVGINTDVTVTNLQWGNLVNLSDARYGIDNLQLRPAQLNDSALLTNPLWGAVYSADGRITKLNTNYAYARYDGASFLTSNNTYGVRAIASYTATVSDTTLQAQQEKIQDVTYARTVVNQTYDGVAGKFSALGTMISKYAQDKLDSANPGTNLAPYLNTVLTCYNAVRDAMEAQMDAYVAMANFQLYMYAQNTQTLYAPTSWDTILANHARYNIATPTAESTDGIVALMGLTQFVADYNKLVADIGYLNDYYNDYKTNGTSYYWASGGVSGHNIANIVADLIDYNTMTIDLDDKGPETKVVELSSDNASSLLSANGKSRKVYTYNGILIRFEQLAVDESYRLNGRAECTIAVKYILTVTVNGKAYTKASGPATFMQAFTAAQGTLQLAANDSVADDTYGMAVDFWVRTNAEETMLTLEGATAMDEEGHIVSYDGVNRVWGRSEEAEALPVGSTTQGGGSCYVYYADTPEDMARSLDLLEAMRVAFVDTSGNKMAEAEMDTVNVFAANGRITVPMVLTTNTQTTYTYTNSLNEQVIGRAICPLYTDVPMRIEAIVYLDGTKLGNDNVLASSTIQGQLNIQFGSSLSLKTIGSSDLMDDVRVVSAQLTKAELDYDTAVTEEDMTTGVVVHVEGVDPATMSAFFVRAINTQQGSREPTFALTKQENGDWTADYQFEAPGEYYLRYIRMGGVDYPLLEPQKITVKGFKVNSVLWGEGGDSATVRTSENSYTESISVEFATNDRSKMPRTVSARFVRSDGNLVNVPMSYNPNGRWTGKGVFTVSGEYTLAYLLLDGRYRDLTDLGLSKTLNLSLGLRVEVVDGSGKLEERYESGTTYSRDVMVHIYDNVGNGIEGLSGAKLYYSNGGSATNTINTDLTWNEVEGCYVGTLPITKAGRYMFSSVVVGGNLLTNCSASPVYKITSPDPPTYNLASLTTYNGSNVQFAPLTYDAVIDGIKIDHAESAVLEAVVYNAAAKVANPSDAENPYQSGYFTVSGADVYNTGESWCIKLPTYTVDYNSDGTVRDGAKYTQEGTWYVAILRVSECYDADNEYREQDNPIIWAGSDQAATNYLDGLDNVSPDATISFLNLATTVSCTVQVTMVSGSTALGSTDAAFMSHYAVSQIGMKVLLTDNSGRVIPASKVADATLAVSYAPISTNSTYGYKVQSGAARSYTIRLNEQDPETGYRTVSEVNGAADGDWQYVGEYNVQNLTVTLGSTALAYSPGESGVPARYTITTAAPSADNVTLLDENITQRYTTLGKTGNSVTGTFLQAQNPGVSAKVTLNTADGSDTQYVILDDVSMKLLMTYADGKTAPNGGYSWSGTSQYESVTINMTNSSGTYSTSAAPLLSGRYTVKLQATVGSAVTTKNLSNVSVYSRAPAATITAVDPAASEVFDMNINQEAQAYADAKLVSVQNYLSSDGRLANVYIKADKKAENVSEEVTTDVIIYILPKVRVRLDYAGTEFVSAELTVPNAANSSYANTFTFTPSVLTQKADIGGKVAETVQVTATGGCDGET
ncbi:MAG: hypothetical protein IJU18_01380 [Oscillospiraceae bacterium]|nr:hypothetical protein [Oscillospiraceae bacterium]